MTTSEALSHVLRKTRVERNLSQRQVAHLIGFTSKARTYVSKLENGLSSPTLESLERIARAYDMTGSALLRESEELVRAVSTGEVSVPERVGSVRNSGPLFEKPENVVNHGAIERRRKIAMALGTIPMEASA